MKKIESQEKTSFSLILLNFLKGLFSSFFDCLPFFDGKRLKQILSLEKENHFASFFSLTIPTLVATAISVSVFFFIPVDYMIERYHTSIYAGIGIMALLFLAAEIYETIKDRTKEKKHLIASGILFAIFFVLSFTIRYIPFKAVEEESILPFLLLLLLSFSSFLSSFSGISSFSILMFFANYTTFASYLNKTVYGGIKNWLFVFVILFLSYFIGKAFYLFFQDKLDKLTMEKHSVNIALLFSGFLLLVTDRLKAPWYFDFEVITITAQNITLVTTLFAFLLISAILVFPVFRKKKGDEAE